MRSAVARGATPILGNPHRQVNGQPAFIGLQGPAEGRVLLGGMLAHLYDRFMCSM